MNIVVVGGIRTHYIKIHAFQTAWRRLPDEYREKMNVIYVNASQHYDDSLTRFIDELELNFDYTLDHNSKDKYSMICSIFEGLGSVFDDINARIPIDYVVVMGDVTTTVIAAISAYFKGLKIAHIEAGARIEKANSYEERFRTIVDELSSVCFASTKADLQNLLSEGRDNCFFSGDIIWDYLKHYSFDTSIDTVLYRRNGEEISFDLTKEYVLSSLHHDDNLDAEYLQQFFDVLSTYGFKCAFIAHPRVSRIIIDSDIDPHNIVIMDSLSYYDNLQLIKNSLFVITDSGGIQREAYYLNKRCIVRSNSNIWETIVDNNGSIVCDKRKQSLADAIEWANAHRFDEITYDGCFGEGEAVKQIIGVLLNQNEGLK